MRHIGIVGCSAEGAALCYRTICLEGAEQLGGHDHPEVSLHTHSLGEYMRRIDDGRWDRVGDLMLSSAESLASGGADFLICPDNTIHQAFDYVQARSPLPWLHIAEVVADEAKRRDFKRIGLLGTKWLLASEVYPGKLSALGLSHLRPQEQGRNELSRIIMDELVHGVFRPESISTFQRVIGELKEAGADSVVLGCTEIPLIISDENSALPTLDSTRLLARSALAHSMVP